MKKKCLILFLILIFGNFIAQGQFTIREKIVPLHSTRSDVETIAKFVKDFQAYIRYETDDAILDVSYNRTKCDKNGWNVPTDRVLSYSYYPKREKELKDVLSAKTNVIKIADDGGAIHHLNPIDGTDIVIAAKAKPVSYIEFFPTEFDNNLRCKGFPAFSIVSNFYRRFEHFTMNNPLSWDATKIVDTFARIETNPNSKGYIFVYCKKGQLAKCNQLKKKIEAASKLFMKTRATQVIVSVGGYRDEAEVESFLIPKDYPRVIARPIYPSNF